MYYCNMVKGNFIARPNRFIAHVLIDGTEEICHVKNTGRCKELLIPQQEVYLQHHNDTKRKTQYSLIAVQKGERLINIDSQAPNTVVKEWILQNHLFKNITLLKGEQCFENSRFDFYVETEEKAYYIEVKGVTLEEEGVALFPDAPTQRGIKHIKELCRCRDAGFGAYIIFVVQMSDVKYFMPNFKTHAAFGSALKCAQEYGVQILALDCNVSVDTLTIKSQIPIQLSY